MRFRAVKGTRDFYPDRMALRNHLVEAWRRVSRRNGFVEFDGPVLEYLDLFSVKSGEEIVSQLFSFTDRGGRDLAMRPEITPTLARMVNVRINSLPRPIKWFSVPRLFRAENPQKGRLREFFQWNVDIIGSDDVLADAECIFTAVDFLREMDLTPEDVTVRIGSRPLTVAALKRAGVDESAMEGALAALDKRTRVASEAFAEIAAAAGIPAERLDEVCAFQDAPDLSGVSSALGGGGGRIADEIGRLDALMGYLRSMGAGDYCRLDMRIVRGLAYYTGIVYEIFDAAGAMRAVAGGGRYDNLLNLFGGPEIGATGFGMGDAVLEEILKQTGKLPDVSAGLDCFVIDGGAVGLDRVLEVVGRLRRGGIAADFSAKQTAKPQAVGKQLKEANRRNARYAVILRADDVGVKNLATGEQVDVSVDEFLTRPAAYLT